MIGPRTSIAARPHRVRVQNPEPPLVDGDGGTLPLEYFDATPPFTYARIAPATAQDLERLAAGGGASISTAPHVVRCPFHPQVTTQTRFLYTDQRGTHVLGVVGVGTPELRNVETEALCIEVIQ